ncbi:MAG TPA: prepilin-type N-terminal cleavage/methylation domain-containing protein [Phycisphaerales bacterium]|nr:prepilin-type N-terminal cleavage/methylation domain-containing protein [Phycisphaerales bacterium]
MLTFSSSTVRRAFTLVEILIVVVILGILAAIVVPQFAQATQDSKAGNLKSQLGTLQRQIELYRSKNARFPDFAADQWGDTSAAGTLVGGGYIKMAPVNAAWPDATDAARYAIATTTGAGERGSATAGWLWNEADSTLYASYFDETLGQVTAIAED